MPYDTGTGQLINQLTNPPNPFDKLGGTVDFANKIKDFQANQAAANAYQQAIRPDGSFDQGLFNSLTSQAPGGSWQFGKRMEESGRGYTAQGQGTIANTEAARDQLTMLNGYLTPLLKDAQNGTPVTQDQIKAVLDNAIGLTPQMQQAVRAKVGTLAPGQDAGPMLLGWQFATQSPEGQASRTMTTTAQNLEHMRWLSEQGWYPDPDDPTKQKYGPRSQALADYGQNPSVLNNFIVRGFTGARPGMGGQGGAGSQGGGKDGTPGPQSSNQYSGSGNEFLANQRAPIAAELANNPTLRNEVLAMAVTEDRDDPAGPIESLFNRAAYTGQSVSSLLHSGFYGPINRGALPGAVALLNSDSDLRARMESGLNAVLSGSNRLQGATDQGGPGDPNAGWKGGLVRPPGASAGAIYNDWGGGPGGHEGAAAWRREQQAKVNAAQKPVQVASAQPTTATDAQPGGYGPGATGVYVPPGGGQPLDIASGRPVNLATGAVAPPAAAAASTLTAGGGAQVAAPPIQLAQNGFPMGRTVSRPLDYETTIKNSTEAYNRALNDYSSLPDRMTNLTQAADILKNNPNLATGTGAEDVQKLNNIAHTVLGITLSPETNNNLAALTELNKDLERYYLARPNASRSDLAQTETKLANPTIQMQREALSDLLAKTIGLERFNSSAYQDFVGRHGGAARAGIDAPSFAGETAAYRNQFDPVAFGAEYMTKEQLSQYYNGLPNQGAKDRFWNSLLQAEKQYNFKVQP